jgi:hypothetical protein
MSIEKRNNDISLKLLLFKIFDKIYLISIIALMLNSIWYFIRLIFFGRRISIMFVEFHHFTLFIFLIISIVALKKYVKNNITQGIEMLFPRTIFIVFVNIVVSLTIYHTYYSISPYVRRFWESGEWTF